MLPIRCGTDEPVLFRVSVDASARVVEVAPLDPKAPETVVRAARCLVAHSDALDGLVARSRQTPPFEFEYGVGPTFCDAPETGSPRS